MVNMNRRLLDSDQQSVPPLHANGTNDSYINKTNFDTQMVIILAALLCALVSALGLNSMVRCALRCRHRFSTETPEQAAVRLSPAGLKKRDLKQIPVAVYGGAGVSFRTTDCAICLGEFVVGEEVRVLPKCNHGFHARCIDKWLVSHSSCPNCRCSLLEKHTTPPSTVVEEVSSARPNEPSQQGNVVVVVEGTG